MTKQTNKQKVQKSTNTHMDKQMFAHTDFLFKKK